MGDTKQAEEAMIERYGKLIELARYAARGGALRPEAANDEGARPTVWERGYQHGYADGHLHGLVAGVILIALVFVCGMIAGYVLYGFHG